MSISPKWVPIGLVLVGTTLVLVALLILLITGAPDYFGNIPYPDELRGRSKISFIHGKDAVSEFIQLHNKTVEVKDGVKVVYGSDGEFTLWVSESRTNAEASRLLTRMQEKIAEGNSPFTAKGDFTNNGITVYALAGMGQSHYYFQSGRYVVWLAAIPAEADAALQTVLEYYR